MRELKIPKRSGGHRIVVAPTKAEKRRLRAMLPELTAAAMLSDVDGVQHGFTPARSAITNAQAHIGYQITLSWDLQACFDHLTREVVRHTLPYECYHEGVARQGLPTSPAICNLALAPLDRAVMAIVHAAHDVGLRAAYTRYADDLTVSVDDERLAQVFAQRVPALAESHGTPVNPEKTRLQRAKAGRRIITGVAVSDTGLHPTRAAKRRLRAARHQGRTRHARGLAEWCRLAPPDPLRAIERQLDSRAPAAGAIADLIATHHRTQQRRTHT